MNKKRNILLLLTELVALGLLAYGFLMNKEPISIAGACLFLLADWINLFAEYKEAKMFRAETWKPTEKLDFLEVFNRRLRSGIFLVGLGSILFGHSSGLVILSGAVINQVISDYILRDVAGLPLERRYGVLRRIQPRRRQR
jgi:hypothetical protein